MTITRACLILFFCSLLLPLHAQQQQQHQQPGKAKAAKIDEIIQLSRADQMTKAMVDQMKMQVQQQIAATTPPEQRADAEKRVKAVVELIASALDFSKMKPDYVKLYDETFTESEIDGILTFYRSPAGQAFLDKLPLLTQRAMELGQKRMLEVQPKLIEIMQGAGAQAK